MVRVDFTLLFYAALVGLFAGVVLYAVSFGGSSGLVPAAPGSVVVMYLYPLQCVDCAKRIPPTCDTCMTYYSDSGVLSAIAGDVGVPFTPYVSGSVSEPTLLVAKDGVVSLGDARTKLSIASTLCSIVKNKESCKVLNDRLFSVKKCFEQYNISRDMLVYQYSESCSHCAKVSEALDKLLQTPQLGRSYKAVSIDSQSESQMKVLTSCAGDIVNTRYVPNVLCPANGKVKTGELTFSELRDFADDCIDAAGG